MDNVGFVTPYKGFSALRYGGMIAERVLRMGGKLMPTALGDVSLRRPTIDAKSVLMPGLEQARALLLSSHPQFDPYVERWRVEEALRKTLNGDYSEGPALIQLITFRLFLDIFG